MELVHQTSGERIPITAADIDAMLADFSGFHRIEREGDRLVLFALNAKRLHWYTVDIWRIEN